MPFLKRKNPRKSKKRNLPNFQEAKRDLFQKKKKKEWLMPFLKRKNPRKKPRNLPNFQEAKRGPVLKKEKKKERLIPFLKRKNPKKITNKKEDKRDLFLKKKRKRNS